MPLSNTLEPSMTLELRHEIEQLLEDLTPDSLMTMRQFAAFLQTQQNRGQSTFFGGASDAELAANAPLEKNGINQQAWVAVSATDVLRLTSVLANGYEGDALADTEAI